jgi:hypothetical protein
MTRVGFELTTRVLERAKRVHALDRAATVIGTNHTTDIKLCRDKFFLLYFVKYSLHRKTSRQKLLILSNLLYVLYQFLRLPIFLTKMPLVHRITGVFYFFHRPKFYGIEPRRFENWICFRPQVRLTSWSQSHVTTDCQSVSRYTRLWGLRPDLYYSHLRFWRCGVPFQQFLYCYLLIATETCLQRLCLVVFAFIHSIIPACSRRVSIKIYSGSKSFISYTSQILRSLS